MPWAIRNSAADPKSAFPVADPPGVRLPLPRGIRGGGGMDIHKPKPWRSIREFLKEYLIIVVGVLTALGAEQAVEWVHVRADVREAREALHDELATNAMIATWSIQEDRCLAKSLDQYVTWAKGGPRPPTFRGGFPPFNSATWEEVRSGAVAHMPLRERLALAQFYDEIANQRSVLEYERNAYRPLIALSEHETLDAATAQRLLEVVAEARLFGRVRSGNSQSLIAHAKQLGAEPKPLPPYVVKRLALQCGATGQADAA